MAESIYCDISCNWNVIGRCGWPDILQYFMLDDEDRDELRDSDDVFIKLQPTDVSTPHCEVTVKCRPEYRMSSVVVVSESRTQEVYDRRGEYIQTVHSKVYREDESGLLYVSVFRFELPVCNLKLKFLKLEMRELFHICHFVLHFYRLAPEVEVPLEPSGAINYETVRSMLNEMGTHLPPGAESLINSLEDCQKNGRTGGDIGSLVSAVANTFGVPSMKGVLSKLNPFTAGKSEEAETGENKELNRGDSASVNRQMPFDSRLLEDMEWRLYRHMDYKEERMMTYIDERLIYIENKLTECVDVAFARFEQNIGHYLARYTQVTPGTDNSQCPQTQAAAHPHSAPCRPAPPGGIVWSAKDKNVGQCAPPDQRRSRYHSVPGSCIHHDPDTAQAQFRVSGKVINNIGYVLVDQRDADDLNNSVNDDELDEVPPVGPIYVGTQGHARIDGLGPAYVDNVGLAYVDNVGHAYVDTLGHKHVDNVRSDHIDKVGVAYVDNVGRAYVDTLGHEHVDKTEPKYVDKIGSTYVDNVGHTYVDKPGHEFVDNEGHMYADKVWHSSGDTQGHAHVDISRPEHLDRVDYADKQDLTQPYKQEHKIAPEEATNTLDIPLTDISSCDSWSGEQNQLDPSFDVVTSYTHSTVNTHICDNLQRSRINETTNIEVMSGVNKEECGAKLGTIIVNKLVDNIDGLDDCREILASRNVAPGDRITCANGAAAVTRQCESRVVCNDGKTLVDMCAVKTGGSDDDKKGVTEGVDISRLGNGEQAVISIGDFTRVDEASEGRPMDADSDIATSTESCSIIYDIESLGSWNEIGDVSSSKSGNN